MAIRFNHLNIVAAENSKLQNLLVDILGLNVGYRPEFPFGGAWLYQGDKALVHIIESKCVQTCEFGHIAFDVDMNLPVLTHQLNQLSLKYNVRQVPDSVVLQVFIKLDKLVIELQVIDEK